MFSLCCDVRDKEYSHLVKHIKQLIKLEGFYFNGNDLLSKDGRFSPIGTYILNIRHHTKPGERDACLVAKEVSNER